MSATTFWPKSVWAHTKPIYLFQTPLCGGNHFFHLYIIYTTQSGIMYFTAGKYPFIHCKQIIQIIVRFIPILFIHYFIDNNICWLYSFALCNWVQIMHIELVLMLILDNTSRSQCDTERSYLLFNIPKIIINIKIFYTPTCIRVNKQTTEQISRWHQDIISNPPISALVSDRLLL